MSLSIPHPLSPCACKRGAPNKPLNLRALGCALAVCLGSSPAWAVPGQLSYSGQILAEGKPLSGPLAARFALYDTATGGTPLWEEEHGAVPVTGGLFSVLLGSNATLDTKVFSGRTRWLEVAVNNQTLLPRVPIASVPYALRAAEATAAINATGDITPRSLKINGKQIVDAQGSLVASLVCSCGGPACWSTTRESYRAGSRNVECTRTRLCTPSGLVTVGQYCPPSDN